MEYYTISRTDTGLQIKDFPDAVKVIAINSPEAKRLADLSLHNEDLKFVDACLDAIGATLNQGNYSNLKILIQKANVWVVSEFDALCERLTSELEKESYSRLISREALTYQVPSVADISHSRQTKRNKGSAE